MCVRLCQTKWQIWLKGSNSLQNVIQSSYKCIDDHLCEGCTMMRMWLCHPKGKIWSKRWNTLKCFTQHFNQSIDDNFG